jgi:GTP-binding protein HflX
VTSFRATLEAEILLHVQDAASPAREEQKVQVEKVLAEIGVSAKLVIQVLNKIDLIPPQEIAHLSDDHEAILVSSLQHTNLEQLLVAIDAALVIDPLVEFKFRFPQSDGSILASLESRAIVDEKRFEGNLVFLRARGPASLLDRYRRSATNVIFLANAYERTTHNHPSDLGIAYFPLRKEMPTRPTAWN